MSIDRDDDGPGLGFGMSLDLNTTCAKCGRERELPEPGSRRPMSGESTLVVDADTPCPHCGATRLKITISIS